MIVRTLVFLLTFCLKPDPAIKGIATFHASRVCLLCRIILRLKPDPAIKGIATYRYNRSRASLAEAKSETRPCYKRDCDASEMRYAHLFLMLCLKPDPAIKGIATPHLGGRTRPPRGRSSETRPCYKRDCDCENYVVGDVVYVIDV